MKRSTEISLLIVPLLATACTSQQPADPCLPQTYSAPACQVAVEKGGYFYDGSWYPHVYSHPFIYYAGGYSSFIAGGGRPVMTNAARYSAMPAAPTTRGGFGGSGAARSSSVPHASFSAGG